MLATSRLRFCTVGLSLTLLAPPRTASAWLEHPWVGMAPAPAMLSQPPTTLDQLSLAFC